VREITPVDPEGASVGAGSTESRLDLSAALERLDAADRQLLAMRYLAGLTAEEIGAATGRSASGVRTHLSRIVQRLREELNQ